MYNSENSLIKITPGLLAAFASGALEKINLFGEDIAVLNCVVAGTMFTKAHSLALLIEKVKITLKREPKNKYDPLAIALYFGKEKIGYIPKDRNEVVAKLMDAGKQFYAIIQTKAMEGTWLKLEIEVWLKQ